MQQMIEGSISSRNVVWGGVKTMLIPVGLIRMTNVMNALGDVSDVVIWSGIKSSMIPFACSLIVYIISLIIRIALQPRKKFVSA